ncbi:MAG: hypothetical protein H6Q69_4884 [Firmicutes bacterium]|nr:hypothetical protein [Bacillota bacterium]
MNHCLKKDISAKQKNDITAEAQSTQRDILNPVFVFSAPLRLKKYSSIFLIGNGEKQ